jgi:dolichol-phosphate mannosyltransferase
VPIFSCEAPDRISPGGIESTIAVVTPMANEKQTAELFLRELMTVMEGIGPFIIFVVFDNACTDGTVDLVKARFHDDRRVHVIWAPENVCVVDAYVRGYLEALASGADRILEIDAGFSHRPSEIHKLVRAMEMGHDCVFGSRFCPGGQLRNASTLQYVMSRGGTLLTNLLIGTRLHDMTSGFQLFRRAALQRILTTNLRSRGPFFQTEMKIRARKMKIVEIPICYTATPSTTSIGAAFDALKVLLMLSGLRLIGLL